MATYQEANEENISMITDILVAPVTAVLFHNQLLLTGEGPNLHIYDTKTQRKITSHRVFKSKRIHGVRKSKDNYFVVYGQKTFCMLSISWQSNIETCRIQSQMEVLELSDWIWDVQCLDNINHVAVALGHNSIELWDWRESVLLKEVHCEEKCILYCARFINNTWSQLVLFAGTVFNQVLLWRPSGKRNNDGRVIADLRCKGHEGVIFNVQYNATHKLLCSVSDDRSIRLWHIESLECPSSQILTDADLVMYGHNARVWDVRLLTNKVISIGEDATCIVWNYKGEILQKFKGHKGRSIWSLAIDEHETMIATGGGDSSVRLWFLDAASQNDAVVENIGLQSYIKSNDASDNEDFARTVMLTNGGEVLTMTNAGYLLGYQLQEHVWRIISHDKKFQSYGIASLSPSHQFVALGNIHGDIKVVNLSNPKNTQFLNAFDSKVLGLCWADDHHLFSTGPDGQLILWQVHLTENKLSAVKYMVFLVPESRQRWITTATILPQEMGFLCGDKRGSLHHYKCPPDSSIEPVAPVTTLRAVHGKVGVTDVCYHDNHIYSTGRDGTYKQYEFQSGILQVMNTNKIYKGFEWIEKLIIKENGEIQALGFHTSDFVLWSVTQNQKLFSVRCGGGHRTWGFAEPGNTACMAFIKARDVFVCKQYGLQKQHILKDSLHGRELTCAKLLGRISVKGTKYLLVATGSEDTMVNIVAIDCKTSEAVVVKTLQDHISSVRDLATCKYHLDHVEHEKSESMDSQKEQNENGMQKSILLFSVGGRCSIKCWKITTQEYANNFPSACTVSLLGSYGSVETCQRHKRLKHGQLIDPDTRYMALQVLPAQDVDKSLSPYNYFLTLAASDGVIRLFNFNEIQKTFNAVWSSAWHNVCLLSLTQVIHELPEGNAAVVCSAGTDGKVALWDITNFIQNYSSDIDTKKVDRFVNSEENISSEELNNFKATKDVATVSNMPDNSEDCEMSKKNDTELNNAQFLKSVVEGNQLPVFWTRIHQSGINAMDLTKRGSEYLLATGGDDNAISVITLKVKGHEVGHISFEVGNSYSIPSAHATLISGIRFLDEQTFISSSIDQRLNTWKINQNNIKQIGSEFTHVADTSGLDTMRIKDKFYILIPGQGLQLLSTSWKTEESEEL